MNTNKNTHIKPQEFFCEICNYKCYHKNDFTKHLMTLKHKKMANPKQKTHIKSPDFFCKLCDFKCSNKNDYNRHLMTRKHKKTEKPQQKTQIEYKCGCGKKYKHLSSLCSHKRNCNDIHKQNDNVCNNDINLFMKELQKRDEENKKLREEQHKRDIEHKKDIEKLSSQISQISTVTTNTTNNNKFNLNFFLNTQCKDAMSIQSFMENLSIGSKELEHMGDVGFLNGMIDIFNNTIGNMDIHKRPLHCTDKKREVLYFKQGDEWEKDSTDKQQLKKLIKDVETKNYYNVRDWSRAHKDSFTSETAAGDQYMKIATEALGGADSTKDSIYLSKIMKHIIREVTVKA